jgi:hypothetical protein
MIAVQMCDEDTRDLTDLHIAVKELMLRRFAAIKEPHFGALRQTQRHTKHSASASARPHLFQES